MSRILYWNTCFSDFFSLSIQIPVCEGSQSTSPRSSSPITICIVPIYYTNILCKLYSPILLIGYYMILYYTYIFQRTHPLYVDIPFLVQALHPTKSLHKIVTASSTWGHVFVSHTVPYSSTMIILCCPWRYARTHYLLLFERIYKEQ